MLEYALYNKMTASTSAVRALIGVNIFPTIAPETQDAPFLTYHRVGAGVDHHLTGVAETKSATIDFYAWTSAPLLALQIADAIIDTFVMVKYVDSSAGVTIDGAKLDNIVSFYEAESRLYRTATTITFRYTDT